MTEVVWNEILRRAFRGKCALVTGGLGFLGSNLTLRLLDYGARVIVVDPIVPGCGGNLNNLRDAADGVDIISRNIAEAESFRSAIKASDVIFNLAGEISHVHSMELPLRDLELNTEAHLRFLKECAREHPGVRTVYSSTRQVYGIPEYLPVDEDHPLNPVDFNGVHKHAAAGYHHLLTRVGGLDAVELRISNVYGPRMALDIPCQGFLGTFLRRALLGQPIELFDGNQLRDPVYVDDVVDALLIAGSAPTGRRRVFNIGGPVALTLRTVADQISEAAGPVPIRLRPFPESRKRIDIGSYFTDSRRIGREWGWRPTTSFAAGVERTIEFYRSQLCEYLGPYLANPTLEPTCSLPEHAGLGRPVVVKSRPERRIEPG